MMKNIKLNNGVSIPQVGLGLWKVKDEKTCIDSVKAALSYGYRHFDTAQIYHNEHFLGEALEGSGIPRSDLFITTKIWNDNQFWENVLPSFDESLKNLRSDYVDLLLLHFPVTHTRHMGWMRMEEIYKSGKAKAIGVSNFTIKHIEEFMGRFDIKPVVNQVELHVFLQQPELIKFCQQNDIVIEAYSPLAHGQKIDNKVLAGIAKRYNKSPTQIMLRWLIENGLVILPKSVHPNRIKENIEVFDFTLNNEDMIAISKLDCNYRTCWDPTKVA